MVIDAGAAGEAKRAAEIAVLLTERGLGGNEVDLAVRLDGLARDRSQRATQARGMARRWAETAASDPGGDSALGVGAILALAYPDRIAKNRGSDGSFCWPMAAADASIRCRRFRASLISRSPRSPAAPRRGESRWRRPGYRRRSRLAKLGTSKRARSWFSMRQAPACGRGGRVAWARLCSTSSRWRSRPAKQAPSSWLEASPRLGIDRLPWTKALSQWRDRVLFLRHAEGDEWPDLSDAALAGASDWLVGLMLHRAGACWLKSRAKTSPMRSLRCCRGTCAAGSMSRRRTHSPPRPPVLRCRSTTRRKAVRKLAGQGAGADLGLDRHPTHR